MPSSTEANAYFTKRESRLFSYYQSTKCLLIFRNSYWGGCSGDLPSNKIVKNRNKFVETYNISGYKNPSNMTQKMKKKTFIFHDKNNNKIEPPKGFHRHCFQWDAGMSKDHKEYYTIKGTNGKSFCSTIQPIQTF